MLSALGKGVTNRNSVGLNSNLRKHCCGNLTREKTLKVRRGRRGPVYMIHIENRGYLIIASE